MKKVILLIILILVAYSQSVLSACIDSDGGAILEMTGITNNETVDVVDSCTGQFHINEGTCEDGAVIIKEFLACPANAATCQSGACVSQGNGGRQPLPEAGYPCTITDISWQDEYGNDVEESGVSLKVIGLVTGQGCENEYFTLSIIDASDDSVAELLGDFDFGLNDETALWYNLSAWSPQSEGEYYLRARVVREGSYSYEEDNSDRPLFVTNNCKPEELPESIDCELDPITGEQLPSGIDLDCDGVDDCIDQWIYSYGGDVDPENGIPVVLDCISSWDCTQAEWGPCSRNQNGRLTKTRDITRCTLPEGSSCPALPSEEKICILEEQFPAFGWMNMLMISFLLIGYYLFRKKL